MNANKYYDDVANATFYAAIANAAKSNSAVFGRY